MENILNSPVSFLFYVAALIVAITIHEFSHAWSADHLGDPTPRLQGRLTLNPLAHLDPLGTILLFLVHFGWGKPVQFDPFNLRNPRRDAALISLAGPAANLLLATVCSIALRILSPLQLPVPRTLRDDFSAVFTFSLVWPGPNLPDPKSRSQFFPKSPTSRLRQFGLIQSFY
ncbi:MAG: Peptidase M50 [Candidatus Gottesmanbacteria bacterium GW2011_GWB1_43_11]|uniref:Peptidase M50 n=1 Tax=Candidatus Gottesmanbacteria bacterium GW2011_GWB1_43_11 TaxID=1618446 RepID=A0A0G1CP07_9BACT|nr:MAG: Peptidase M50 [Candidatus Gottesmanbacteria bacterium GW2011_GWB1_43_11]